MSWNMKCISWLSFARRFPLAPSKGSELALSEALACSWRVLEARVPWGIELVQKVVPDCLILKVVVDRPVDTQLCLLTDELQHGPNTLCHVEVFSLAALFPGIHSEQFQCIQQWLRWGYFPFLLALGQKTRPSGSQSQHPPHLEVNVFVPSDTAEGVEGTPGVLTLLTGVCVCVQVCACVIVCECVHVRL